MSLKDIREKKGLTQIDLIIKMKEKNVKPYSLSTLNRWEQGKNLPRYDGLKSLSKALDISIEELVSNW